MRVGSEPGESENLRIAVRGLLVDQLDGIRTPHRKRRGSCSLLFRTCLNALFTENAQTHSAAFTMNSIAVQEEVQSLKDHGRYEAAVEHLQLPESKASLSPLRHAQTLSEVLLAQGYLGKTLRCIEDAISAARNAPCDDSEVLLRLRMRMWANAIRPAAHPSLKGLSASYQDGKQAIEELGKLCNESDVREDVVRESYV